MDAKSLIELPFIVLLYTEGRNEVDCSVEENQAVDFSVCVSSSCLVLYQLASLGLLL